MNPQTLKNSILAGLAVSLTTAALLASADAAERKQTLQPMTLQKTTPMKHKGPKDIAAPGLKPDLVVLPKFGGNNGLPNSGYCGAWNGGNQSVRLIVKNIGAAPAPKSEVWVSFDDQGPGMLKKIAVPALVAGQPYNVSVPIPAQAWSPGDHPSVDFSWHADGQWIIDESKESNNGGDAFCMGPAG